MSEPAAVLECGALRVVFTRRADRVGHSIELVDGPQVVTLLESVEGAPEDDWPPSPPFQSLHIENRGDGRRVALLVGMAGRSHWSASVEPDPANGQFVFDVACRINVQPEFLGSSYLDSGGGPFRIATATSNGGSPQISNQSGRWCIHTSVVDGELPKTIRWIYSVRQ